MKQRYREFDTTDMDTCMNRWSFLINRIGDQTIIDSVTIERDKHGCPGHPKTISALVQNIPVESLNIEALSKTECSCGMSCGMVLSDCVTKLLERDRESNG